MTDSLEFKKWAYADLLVEHDWNFEWSDDHRVWERGHQMLAKLRKMQPVVDPDGVLWNRHAPDRHKIQVCSANT